MNVQRIHTYTHHRHSLRIAKKKGTIFVASRSDSSYSTRRLIVTARSCNTKGLKGAGGECGGDLHIGYTPTNARPRQISLFTEGGNKCPRLAALRTSVAAYEQQQQCRTKAFILTRVFTSMPFFMNTKLWIHVYLSRRGAPVDNAFSTVKPLTSTIPQKTSHSWPLPRERKTWSAPAPVM